MPEIHDWQHVADPHAVIRYAVQSLLQGRTVAFPSESGYTVTASGLVLEAVRRLGADAGNSAGLTVAVRGAAAARDWAPAMSPLSRRLARRLWPGPVTLIVGGIEGGLASRLTEEIRVQLCIEGRLRLSSPRHEALREVLRQLPGPLVMTMGRGEGDGLPAAADVIVADETASSQQPATVIAVNGDSWDIVQRGAVSAEQIHQHTACLVLFVCTGNTCRSPLAEAFCKKLLAERLGCSIQELPARGYLVLSAGLAATAGGAAAAEAEQAARSYGADLSAHRSQPLTQELVERADYLLGMTHSHVRALTDYFGHLGVTPRSLDPSGDIADPIGGDQAIYDECSQQIRRCLEVLIAELVPSEAQQS